jgi:hypothetical protein
LGVGVLLAAGLEGLRVGVFFSVRTGDDF